MERQNERQNAVYINFERMPAAEVDFVIQKKGKIIPIEVKYDTGVR